MIERLLASAALPRSLAAKAIGVEDVAAGTEFVRQKTTVG
jgi:hypothetical protein